MYIGCFSQLQITDNSCSAIALNPQPEPPGKRVSEEWLPDPVRRNAEPLNPQPEPPGKRVSEEWLPDPVRRNAEPLRPQPEPPGKRG